MENIQTISRMIDLIYSPDDNGYYYQEYSKTSNKCRVSKQTFKDKRQAILAMNLGKVKWTKWS